MLSVGDSFPSELRVFPLRDEHLNRVCRMVQDQQGQLMDVHRCRRRVRSPRSWEVLKDRLCGNKKWEPTPAS